MESILADTTILVAIIGVLGGLPMVLMQSRSARDKMTEERVTRILEQQDEDIVGLKERTEILEGKVKSLRAENKRVWELFSTAVDHLSNRLRWERAGRQWEEPVVPSKLREHLPEELL